MSDYDFDFFRGDDHTLNLTITDEDDAVVDLTGWVFRLTMKSDYDDADDDAAVKVDGSALAGVDAEAGLVTILIPSADTTLIDSGLYFIDIQAENGGAISTVYSGTVYVKPDVTRRTSA